MSRHSMEHMSWKKGSRPRLSQTGPVPVTTCQAEEDFVTKTTFLGGKSESLNTVKTRTDLTIVPRLRSSWSMVARQHDRDRSNSDLSK